MPELPEVETVRTGLAPVMEGRVIGQVQVNRANLRFPFPENMAARLTGQTILRLRRRSKYILADLSGGETLLIHLGMTGRMLVSGAPLGVFYFEHPAPEKHDHVVFDLEGGARITFNDARRFGAMDLFETASADQHWLLKDIGPEPLGNGFDENHLAAKLSGKGSPIKTLLLDQRLVAGLGNIYVCEALYRASILPTRKGREITMAEVARLVPVIRDVLREAIAAGGSSLKDYRQADGELGYFQHNFSVYGREGEPCRTEGCGGQVARLVQGGRSSFYCPHCQH